MNLILLVASILLFCIAALLGFGVFDGSHILGWISAGLAAFAAAFLVPYGPVVARRSE